MSREVKFQAFYDKKMWEVFAIDWALKICRIFCQVNATDSICLSDIPFSQIKLRQYTGLKDKNSVEIYEGDVLSYWDGTLVPDENGDIKYDIGTFRRTINKKAQVIYEAPSFKICATNPIDCQYVGNSLGSRYIESHNIEVLGNIYENLELLEEGKDE